MGLFQLLGDLSTKLSNRKSRRASRRRSPSDRLHVAYRRLGFERLEDRNMLAVTATFFGNTLNINADANGDTVLVSAVGNTIQVNGGAVVIAGTPVASTALTALNISNFTLNAGDFVSADVTGVTPAQFSALQNFGYFGSAGQDFLTMGDLANTANVAFFGNGGGADAVSLFGVATIDVASLSVQGGLTQVLPGLANISTSGFQQYGNVDLFPAAVTFTDTGAGGINFGGRVDGASAVAVNTPGETRFSGPVGQFLPLASLSTNAGGTTVFAAGPVITTGAQTYSDNVNVTALGAVGFTSTNNQAITFAGALDGSNATDVTVNTGGTTTFGGAVGALSPLRTLLTFGGGVTAINGGSVNTVGFNVFGVEGQVYFDAVTLGANTTLNTGLGAATLNETVNSSGVARSLTINSQGDTNFFSAVGGVSPLASLRTDAGGRTTFFAVAGGGAITTSGAAGQLFGDAVLLREFTTLTALNNGAVTFNSTVDVELDPNDGLTINTGGVTTFNGAVGSGAVILNSLTTNAGGSTIFNTNVVRTGGLQTYNDNVTYNAATTFVTATTARYNAQLNLLANLVSITGNFTLGAAANVFSNWTSLVTFGRVIRTGTATLAGSINVTTSFAPPVGSLFQVVGGGGALVGAFTGGTANANMQLRALYGGGNATLQVVRRATGLPVVPGLVGMLAGLASNPNIGRIAIRLF